MKAVRTIREVMNKVLMGVCVFLFAFMVLVGTYQICTRYFLGKPSTISEELLTFTFTWMALLASAYVFGKRDHMRMSFLADKIKGRAKQILDVAIEALIFCFAALAMIWGGWSIMMLSMQQQTASLGVPMGYIYIVLPLAGCFIAVYAILNIIELCHGEKVEMRNGFEEKGDVA